MKADRDAPLVMADIRTYEMGNTPILIYRGWRWPVVRNGVVDESRRILFEQDRAGDWIAVTVH